jgi:hypothetical protein
LDRRLGGPRAVLDAAAAAAAAVVAAAAAAAVAVIVVIVNNKYVHNGSGANPASYPIGAGGLFPWG